MPVRTNSGYRDDHNLPVEIRSEHFASLPRTGFIREKRLLREFVPFSRATLWRNVANQTFPKPVKLSSRVTAWRVEDLLAWMGALETSSVR